MSIVIDGKKLQSIPQMRRFGESKSGRVNHQRIVANGIEFDSKAEHDRYLELLVMERAGVISQLECHPRWEIIPAQKIPGHRQFNAAHYTADFKYIRDGKMVVEDVKSSYTREDKAYILRRKLMYQVHGIYVEEVVR
jgi:hypothetical protein